MTKLPAVRGPVRHRPGELAGPNRDRTPEAPAVRPTRNSPEEKREHRGSDTAFCRAPVADLRERPGGCLVVRAAELLVVAGVSGTSSTRPWQQACTTGAALLWRVSATLTLPVLEWLPDGSYRSVLINPKIRGRRREALLAAAAAGTGLDPTLSNRAVHELPLFCLVGGEEDVASVVWQPDGALIQVEIGSALAGVATPRDTRGAFAKVRGTQSPRQGEFMLAATDAMRDKLMQAEGIAVPAVAYRSNEKISPDSAVFFIGIERHFYRLRDPSELLPFLAQRVRALASPPVDREAARNMLESALRSSSKKLTSGHLKITAASITMHIWEGSIQS